MEPHAADISHFENTILQLYDAPRYKAGQTHEPIAVVGLSFGFPQEATSSDAFWEMMIKKRNSITPFPNERLNTSAMYHPDPDRRGQVSIVRQEFQLSH